MTGKTESEPLRGAALDSNEQWEHSTDPSPAPAAPNPEPGGGSATPESPDHVRRKDELEQAYKLAETSYEFFGQTLGRIIWPFSKQLMKETRATFPKDKDIYDEAERVDSFVFWSYLDLRTKTLLTYVLYLLAFTIISSAHLTATIQRGADAVAKSSAANSASKQVERVSASDTSIRTSSVGNSSAEQADKKNREEMIRTIDRILSQIQALPGIVLALGCIILFGIPMWALRSFFRYDRFKDLVSAGERFSHRIHEERNNIAARVQYCSAQIQQQRGNTPWPERAKEWTVVALWNAKRDEYLDRFSTTIAWRIDIYTRLIEYAFVSAKIVLTAIALAWIVSFGYQSLATNETAASIVILSLSLILTGARFWFYSGRKPTNFWTVAFTKEIHRSEAREKHYFVALSSVVENVIVQIQKNQRGGGSS